jgi:hypothetical protein
VMTLFLSELADALSERQRVAKGGDAEGAHQAWHAVMLCSRPIRDLKGQDRGFFVGDARRVPTASDASLGQKIWSINDVGHGVCLLLSLASG